MVDPIHYGRDNTYEFKHEGKSIKLVPAKPSKKDKGNKHGLAIKGQNVQSLRFMRGHELEVAGKETSVIYVLIATDIPPSKHIELVSHKVIRLLEEFKDTVPDELLDGLPPLRDIQHVINLIPGSSFSNRPHYQMNPTEHVELKRQFEGLFKQEFVRESLSPCTVPILLVPKKDES